MSPTGLLPDGELDDSLRGSGSALVAMNRRGSYANAVTADREGRTILAGMAPPRIGFAALRDDGRLDPGFGRAGRVELRVRDGYALLDVAPERNGRLLAALGAGNPTNAAEGEMLGLRLLPNGRLDRSFSRDGRVSTGFGRLLASARVVVQDHLGQLVLAGIAKPPHDSNSDFAAARYLGGS